MEEETKDYKIDLMSSIRIFFSKENWGNSLFVWVVIFLLFSIINTFLPNKSLISLFGVLNIILIIATQGYIKLYLHNVIHNETEILPRFNMKKIIVVFFNICIISIVPVVMFTIFWLFTLPYLNNLKTFNFFNIIYVIILTIVYILINIYSFFINCAYLEDFQLKEGFHYFKIWKNFAIGWSDIIKSYFMSFLILIPLIGFYKLTLYVFEHFQNINYFDIPNFFTYLYFLIFDLVRTNLMGQVYKNTLKGIRSPDRLKKIGILVCLSLVIFLFMYLTKQNLLLLSVHKAVVSGSGLKHLFYSSFVEYTNRYFIGF